ncbi:MAG: hypothetical protein E7129_06340 [Rikenellaceae bacterium]|nr:hypothetical protein [Rikenellaceae bacterium]
MKKYFVRSVKYFVALCVLYVALMALMHYSEHAPITFAQRWELLFATWRGWGMVVATILLAATYPYFGFAKRTFEGNIATDREEFTMAAEVSGLELVSATETELRYRAKGLRRLVKLYEDEVVVRQNGTQVEVGGLRSLSVRLAFDAERFITNKHRREAGEI